MPEFVVVAEHETDARMSFFLANQIFQTEGPAWMDKGYLPRWVNLRGESYPVVTDAEPPPPKCTKWTEVKAMAGGIKLQRNLRRDSNGQAAGFDYAQGRKAAFLFNQLRQTQPVDALILVRDLDDQPQRRTSLEQARRDHPEIITVLATPNPKQEAWVLNLFEPTDEEQPLLEHLRENLGFDPCHKAEELSAKDDTAKRSAKRVVKELTGDNRERKERCWTETALSVLGDDDHPRGKETYLKAYLNEVRQHLLPILDPASVHQKA